MNEPGMPASGQDPKPRPTPSEEATQRAAYARQVISGSQLRSPATNPLPASTTASKTLGQDQLIYLVILGFLLVLGLIIYLIFGLGVASIIFLLLSFALLIGYFLF